MKPMKLEVKREWAPVIERSDLSDGMVSYFAFHPLIAGVTASGPSELEAKENWREALELYLDHCIQHDLPKPAHNRYSFKVSLGRNDAQASSDGVAVTTVVGSEDCA